MKVFQSKVVLITGASSGIGAACAHQFASSGATLILLARRKDRLDAFADEIQGELGTPILTAQLDVRDSTAVFRFVEDLPEPFREIDLLINNAGLSRGFDPLQSGKLDDWEEMIDTNIKGLLYVTRAIVPGMIERGRGHVINIGSIAGRQVYPGGNVYCASKFAVRALSQGLMMDTVNTPVRVSTVDPGMVETEFSLVRFHGDSARAATTYKGLTPLSPNDVAEAIYFVATRPPHANVSELVLLPTDQASVYHANRRQ